MSGKYYIFPFLLAGFFVFSAFPTSHPTTSNGGYTGAPQDGVCTSCHSNQNENLTGEFDVYGFPPIVFRGETYPLTIEVRNPAGDGVRAGFQILALEEDLSNGGDLLAVSEETARKVSNGKRYLGHQPAIDFAADRIARWLGSWTIEDNDDGQLTIYGAAIVGSGGSGNRQDKGLFGQWTVSVRDSNEAVVGLIEKRKEIACAGNNTGSLEIKVYGGVRPYAYAWSNGDTASMIENLAAGSYFATTTDQLGNFWVDTFDLVAPDPITLKNVITDNPNASDATKEGILAFTIDGGTPPYSLVVNGQPVTLDNNQVSLDTLAAGEYVVEVKDANDCTLSETFQVSFTLSANDLSREKLKLHPNPTEGFLFFSNLKDKNIFVVSTMDGKSVKRGRIDNSRLDVSDLNAGIYIISVLEQKGTIQTAKFCKL